MIVRFPRSAIRYTAKKGKPIQMWSGSSPGMPSSKKEEGWNWVALGEGMLLGNV